MTEAEREELIRQLFTLLDEIEDEVRNPYTRARINSAKGLLRKLSDRKTDGESR